MTVRVQFTRVRTDLGHYDIEANSVSEAKAALRKFARADQIVALPIDWQQSSVRIDITGAAEVEASRG